MPATVCSGTGFRKPKERFLSPLGKTNGHLRRRLTAGYDSSQLGTLGTLHSPGSVKSHCHYKEDPKFAQSVIILERGRESLPLFHPRHYRCKLLIEHDPSEDMLRPV